MTSFSRYLSVAVRIPGSLTRYALNRISVMVWTRTISSVSDRHRMVCSSWRVSYYSRCGRCFSEVYHRCHFGVSSQCSWLAVIRGLRSVWISVCAKPEVWIFIRVQTPVLSPQLFQLYRAVKVTLIGVFWRATVGVPCWEKSSLLFVVLGH